jgi:hypothetical protein
LLDVTFELLPITFNLIPVHILLHLIYVKSKKRKSLVSKTALYDEE